MISPEQEKIFEIRASFLQSVFGDGIRSVDSYAVSCPKCCGTTERKHKKKLSIKLADGMHHCWICGLKGRTLQYTIKKYSFNRLSEYCRIFEEEDYNSKIAPEQEQILEVQLPNEYTPIATTMPHDPDHIAVVRYLLKRNIGKEDFYRYRLGTCLVGKLSRRVIMPSFDCDGTLNYYTARSIDSDGAKKYINSKVKRKDIIFNEINIRWNDPLVLVEGPFDLMKCGWNATAMLGSYLDESYLLFQKIVKNQTNIILAMDSDASSKRAKIAQKLKSYGINVKYLNLGKFNDVGEMSRSDFQDALSNAIEWSSVSVLNSKIRKIRSSSIF